MNKFDLNISNYKREELKDMFQLPASYNPQILASTELRLRNGILSNRLLDEETKIKTLYFLSEAKKILLQNTFYSEENQMKDFFNTSSPYNVLPHLDPGAVQETIGQVIDPMSNHPSMLFNKNATKSGGYGNAYGNTNVTIRNYIFNTLFRENFFTTSSTNSTYLLPDTINNVISIDLSGLQFPNFIFTFTKTKKTASIYIKEDGTGLEGLVTIPSGNYDISTMPGVLEKSINLKILGSNVPATNRFKVTISPTTYFTTISNTTNTFSIICNDASGVNIHDPNYVCNNEFNPLLKNFSQTRYKKGDPDPKTDVRPEQYYQSLGWLLGFRLQSYFGKKTYTSDGHFDSSINNYIYFILDDFTNNQYTNTYGLLPSSILTSNILGVIPITAPVFSSTFDNNANFIYKTRNYGGPVDISKIRIQLSNAYGEEVSLHSSDFAFCLQVTCINDPIPPHVIPPHLS